MDREYDYTKIAVKHRFNLTRSLDDYEETIYDKVIRTEYKHIYTCQVDKAGKILFCIMYKDENDKLQYKEFDIKDWTITILHCTDFKVEF